MSRIIQLIDDIEDFFEQCNSLPFTTKVVVEKEDLYELTTELRLKVPDEIKKASRIVDEKESIIEDAKNSADKISKEAEDKILSLVNEHEIMEQAYLKAQIIINEAKQEADEIKAKAMSYIQEAKQESDEVRKSAIEYLDERLEDTEKTTEQALGKLTNNYEQLINELSSYVEVIKSNRAELMTPQDEDIRAAKEQNNLKEEEEEE